MPRHARFIRQITLLVLVTALSCLAPRASAQDEGGTMSATVTTSMGSNATVPVPEPTEQALRYRRSGNVLWFVDLAWAMLVPAVLLLTGLSAGMRDLATRLGRKWFFVVAIYGALFLIVTFVIDLPLSWYEGFVREHAYGLSNQSLGKWLGDELKGLAVGIVGAALVLWIPYLLLKRSPRRWWIYTSVAALPLLIVFMVIGPVWIDPLFNDFGPMKDKALETRILSLAERAGIEGGRVYEVNKSVDTNAVDAYVTGFGSTKRIVLWDTTLAKLTPDEILFVMGHEMGHYVLGHVWKGILFIEGLIIVTLYLVHRLSGALIARFRERFRFDRLSDVASLPLLVFLVAVFTPIIAPPTQAYSRYTEHEADRFGLEITRDNHSAATAFVKLQQENLGIPRPGLLFKIWRESHPPLGERIDFSNDYHPWRDGGELRYERLFKGTHL